MKRTVLISGATGYFGKYLVEDLARDYHVIATSRSLEKLENAFGKNSNVTCVAMDLYDTSHLTKTLEGLATKHDIHGLVNNAYDFSEKTGFNTPSGRFETISNDAMLAGLESGVLAPMIFAQVLGRKMIEKKIRGSIINIASMYGTVAPDARLYEGKKVLNPVTYSVSKAAINGLTRYIASFWGQHGIRCNSISPGSFPNVETDSYNAPKDDEFSTRLKNKTTLGRVGHPKDLLGAIRLLLSDESSYITGQNLGVDGGWTAI
jgi:NAD(P)-dependent dehydrogenase (short-subunit alcohol dehydrogenase family)